MVQQFCEYEIKSLDTILAYRSLKRVNLGLVLFYGGARGVIVIVVGNEHGDTSSNPGRD